MPNPRRSSLLHNRRIATVLGLGISAAALSGLVHLESVWADEDADVADLEDLQAIEDIETDAEIPLAELAPPAAPVLVAVASPQPGLAASEPRPVEPIAAAPAPGPALIAVPDLAGMRVGVAIKTLKALGLRVSVSDEGGDRIDHVDWGSYKVRRQKIDAGVEVAPGSRVSLKANWAPRRLAGGY